MYLVCLNFYVALAVVVVVVVGFGACSVRI